MTKNYSTLIKAFLILVLFINSYSIQPCLAEEAANMENFNIDAFNQNNNGGEWQRSLSDGTKIRTWYNPKGYYHQEVTPLRSAYTYKRVFNTAGDLIGEATDFYSFPVSISRMYDAQGKLIRETNHDEGFAFSVEDLAAKMLAVYKIDILNSDNIYKLNRGTQITPPLFSFYQVYCYDLASPAPQEAVIAFLIDGNTGEVLHTLQTHIMEPTSVLNAYLEKKAAEK